MAENKVRIVIEVDAAKGTAQVKGVGDSFATLQKQASALAGEYGKVSGAAKTTSEEQQKLSDKTRQTSENMSRMAASSRALTGALKSHWMEVSAAAYGAYVVMDKAMNYMALSAKAQQAEESFRLVAKAANESSEQIIAAMKKAAAGTVDDSDIMQKAVKGLALELSGQQMVKIMEAARVSARIVGEDVKKTYEQITDAISTNMPRSLKQMGLITKEQMDLVSRALAAGVTDVRLYDIAMANAAIQSAKMGDAQTNAAEQIQIFNAQVNETKETIGMGLNLALKGAYNSFQLTASAAMSLTSALAFLNAGYFKARVGINELLGAGESAATKGMRETADWYIKFAEDMGNAAGELQDKVLATNAAIAESDKLANKAKADAAKESLKITTDKINAQIGEKARAEELSKAAIKNFDEMLRVMGEFEAEYAKSTKTTEQVEIQSLNARVAKYRQYGADEVRLEQMKQAELRDIMIKGKNELIGLYEELYKGTREEQYAQKAIAAAKEVFDAEEDRLAKLLGSEDDAYKIRIQREKEFTQRFKDSIKDRVEATKDGYEAQLDAARDYAAAAVPSPVAGPAAGGGGLWNPSGFPVGPGSGGPIYNISLVTPQGWGQFSQAMNQIAANTMRTADEAARAAAAQEEETRRAAEQEMRERQQAFQGVYGRYTGMIQERERRNWGITDYTAEFARLGESFAKSSDYQLSLDLLDQMLDAVQSIDRFEEQALQESRKLSDDLAKQGQSIADWLGDLNRSDLAPVQSAEAWGVAFSDKLAAALADPKKNTAAFLGYAREYLDFAKAYADNKDYLTAYQGVTGAVDALGGINKVLGYLSDLGIGSTEGDLGKIIAAFGELGVKAAEIETAVQKATGWTGLTLLNSQIESNLPSAVKIAVGNNGLGWLTNMLGNSIPIATDKSLGDKGLKGVWTALYQALPEAAKKAIGEEGLAALETALGSTTAGLPKSIATAIGATGLKLLADALETTLPEKTGVAIGDTGLALLYAALGITLPEKTKDADTAIGDLKDQLVIAAPKLTDVSGSVAAMSLNVQTKLAEVGSFFDTLATKMGLTLNAGSAEAAIKNLTPATLWQAVTTHMAAYWDWNGVRYAYDPSPLRRAWDPPVQYVPAQDIIRLFNPATGQWKGKGGLTKGITGAGEIGPEWVVPTYEPERSRFLAAAPPAFWDNMVVPGLTYPDLPAPDYDMPQSSPYSRGGGADPEAIGRAVAAQLRPLLAGLASGGGGNARIELHVHLDGREIAHSVENQMRQGHRGLVEQAKRIARLS